MPSQLVRIHLNSWETNMSSQLMQSHLNNWVTHEPIQWVRSEPTTKKLNAFSVSENPPQQLRNQCAFSNIRSHLNNSDMPLPSQLLIKKPSQQLRNPCNLYQDQTLQQYLNEVHGQEIQDPILTLNSNSYVLQWQLLWVFFVRSCDLI